MEFMNRGVRQPQASNHPDSVSPSHTVKNTRGSGFGPKGLRIVQVGLLACVAILIVAAAILIAISDKDKAASTTSESRFVDTSKIQAVFLNNGQIYFGKIGDLNKEYLTLSGIYYVQLNQQVQPGQAAAQQTSPVLFKLGCELHRPQDNMVISRSQVTFWENLKDETNENTIPGGIKKLAEINKDGQKCQTPQTDSVTPPATTKKP